MTQQLEMDFGQNEVKREYTITELNEMIKDMVQKQEEYEKHKEISNIAEAKYRESKEKIVRALEESGLHRYSIPNIGSVAISTKMKVRVPSELDKKEALFNWIEKQYGKEGTLNYTTINYQTLNSFYNQEFEKAALEGRADSFHIDGLDAPIAEKSLSFRRN